MSTPDRRPRVVDFSTHWSGPFASHILTSLGADVVKVENPSIGDGNRGLTPLIEGVGMVHVALNAGTRSLAFDRKSPEWPAVLEALTSWADVVIVGTKPVDAVKRGIDFASLSAHNPKLVYCLISGFGVVGPWQDYSAHGQNIDALAGLVTAAWEDDLPVTPGGWRSSGTTLAGMWAAIGVLGALLRRDRGEVTTAQYVDVSIWGAAVAWQWRDLTTDANLGHPWNDYSELGSRYAMYPTSDDRALLLAPIEQKFWERFCDLIELPEYRADGDWSASGMDFGKGPNAGPERQAIAERTRKRSLDEWITLLEPTKIPFAPLLTYKEAMSGQHGELNGVLSTTTLGDKELSIAAVPVHISAGEGAGEASPPTPVTFSSPPTIGEHNVEILAQIGLGRLARQVASEASR